MMPVAESRKRNTFYNFLIPTLITFATIFLKFFEVRLFLSVLGDSYNGLQSMATQVLSYLNIIELGVGAAFIFHFYKPLAEHNELRVCAVFNGAKIIMRRIGYVFTILLFIAASCYPFFVKDVRNGNFSFVMVSVTIIMLGLSSLYGYFLSAPESLFLTASQKGYIQRLLGLFSTLGIPFVSIILFYSVRLYGEIDRNILYTVILFCKAGISFISSAITVIYVRKKYSYLYRHKEEHDTSIFGMTKDLLPHKIAGLLVFNTIPILLSFFSSLKVVSIYNIYYLLVSYASMILSLVLSAPQTSLGNLLHSDKSRFSKMHKTYENLSFFLVTVATVFMLLFFYPFMKWYLYDKPDYSIVLLMILFSVNFYFRNIRMPFIVLIDITGNYKRTKWISIVEAVVIFSICISGLMIFKEWEKQLIVVSIAPVISYIVYDILQMFTVNKVALNRGFFILFVKWIFSFAVLISVLIVFVFVLPVLKTVQWTFLNLFLYGCLLVFCIGLPSGGYYLYYRTKKRAKG